MLQFLKAEMYSRRALSVLLRMSGAMLVAKLIAVLATPVLTRLFLPEDFSILATFVAITTLVHSFSTCRYEVAIPLAKSDAAAANLMATALSILFAVASLIALVVLVAGDALIERLGVEQLAPYLWLVPLATLLVGCYRVLTYWATRKKALNAISATIVRQAVAGTAIQIVCGLMSVGALGLLVGGVLSQCVGIGRLGRLAFNDLAKPVRSLSIRRMLSMAKRHRNFPRFSVIDALARAGAESIPIILMAAAFGDASLGYFYLALRIMTIPVAVFTQSASRVFYASSARLSGAQLARQVERNFSLATFVGAGPLAAAAFYLPQICEVVMGRGWGQAGLYAQWLLPMAILQCVVAPSSPLVFIRQRQFQNMLAAAGLLGLRMVALLPALCWGTFEDAVAAFAMVGSVWYLVYGLWLAHMCSISPSVWIPRLFVVSAVGTVIGYGLFRLLSLS